MGLGTEWIKLNLVVSTPPTQYTGSNGIQGFQQIGGSGKPPVEATSTADSAPVHWELSVLGNELMTSSISGTKSLSLLSVRALNDLGYTIDVTKADAFSISPSSGRRLRGDDDTNQIEDIRNLQANSSFWETSWTGQVSTDLVETPDAAPASMVGPVVGGLVGVVAVASAFVLYRRRSSASHSKNRLQDNREMVSANPMWHSQA